MSAKPTGLGKGLESLIPADFDSSLLISSAERVQNVFIKSIQPNPDQPRREFEPVSIRELADSIKQYGILQPLIVSPFAPAVPGTEGKTADYTIIAGERRWRAAQEAGLDKVPVIVRKQKEQEKLEIALIENVQRVDLSPVEQAVTIEKLHTQFNMTYTDIAKRLGKAPTTVNNIVRLLQLPETALRALSKGQISEGHARAILALKEQPQRQKELLENIISKGWSVRQAEQFVVGVREGASGTEGRHQRTANTTPDTEALSKQLKTPVSIRRTARGGRLELHFKNEEEFQALLELLRSLRQP